MSKFSESIEHLEEIDDKIMKLINLLADDQTDLRELNPLLAHINISKALGEIIPILKYLLRER